MVVGDIATSNHCLFPDIMGVINKNIRLTRRQVNERVNELAYALVGWAMKKGNRVAVMAENCHEHAVFFFTTAKSGLTTVFLKCHVAPEQPNILLKSCHRILLI